MNLNIDISLAKNYKSSTQIVRVITENWVQNNSYCPNCGNHNLKNYKNNKPVADFYCSECKEDFELKSKCGKLGTKIVDGAYDSMIKRVSSIDNPNFFFLTYDKKYWDVVDFLLIPKHFFVPEIIEKRKPLSDSARRAGWTGCNINLEKIPIIGRVFLVKHSKEIDKEIVLRKWKETLFLRKRISDKKGWLLDILNCIDKIPESDFTLQDLYEFENNLSMKYPNNKFIKDKIRQQLQLLRDNGIIEFKSRGNYRKIFG